MSFRQILASRTTAPAQRFGESLAGRLAPGLPADVVVLNGDPARDLGALASVVYTIRGGRIIHRATP
jgi:imidazolonepropionase-like amidohydrolase